MFFSQFKIPETQVIGIGLIFEFCCMFERNRKKL